MDGETDFSPFGAADPIPLHFFERMRPINAVEILEQAGGVGGDAEHPLAHGLADHGEAADLAFAVDDLLIGEDGAQIGAPIDGGFGDVSEAFGVAVGVFFGFGVEGLWVGERFDRFGLIGGGVEPRVIELEEDPLGPAEVFGIGGIDFAIPVVAEAERLDLASEVIDVGFGGDAGVLAGFDGVLFGGEAEGIPAHWMEHVVASGTLVAGEDIGGSVAFGMTDV